MSAARTFTIPSPRPSTSSRSASSTAGSPKNRSPPCCSSASSWRWMAPTLADETLPCDLCSSPARSATCCRTARRSFRSSMSRPSSSAILKASASTPSWTSLRSSMRASSTGPISETVARSGCPCSPNTSQKTTGVPAGSSVAPSRLTRASIRSSGSAATAMPERSPFTSARKTGTPARESRSARTRSVTVFPVPVAPATRPWRFAMPGRSDRISSPCFATGSGGAAMRDVPPEPCNSTPEARSCDYPLQPVRTPSDEATRSTSVMTPPAVRAPPTPAPWTTSGEPERRTVVAAT